MSQLTQHKYHKSFNLNRCSQFPCEVKELNPPVQATFRYRAVAVTFWLFTKLYLKSSLFLM